MATRFGPFTITPLAGKFPVEITLIEQARITYVDVGTKEDTPEDKRA